MQHRQIMEYTNVRHRIKLALVTVREILLLQFQVKRTNLKTNTYGNNIDYWFFPFNLGNQTALIQKVPENQLIKKGGTAYFDCIYENADFVEWYFKDNGPLETSTR